MRRLTTQHKYILKNIEKMSDFLTDEEFMSLSDKIHELGDITFQIKKTPTAKEATKHTRRKLKL